jgi:ubiquinone/menaquinone biosynthesis C-methylase UbiE
VESEEYLLGVNLGELERLRFQHGVWKTVTDGFFDRLGVGSGWRCLDVGGGPGFVAADLRERVGESGMVTVLDPSSMFVGWFEREARRKQWGNVHTIQGTAERAELPTNAFDLIFIRWVIAFVPSPEEFIHQLLPSLRPGGTIAIQDYYYEGLSLFPRGGAFDRMADVVKAYYRSAGGDAYVAGKIPSILRQNGLALIDFTPHILAGGPKSAIMEWAHRFFVPHIPLMAEKGLITAKEAEEFLADWHNHRADLEALFFSPMVVDVAARKST